ncbi:MAG: hypothetical protein LBH05_05115 [Deferribacteraceae bacterium]|jgi:hypothetical protein|nr:hypothetical protein [Deferribacteraceae bacterium]
MPNVTIYKYLDGHSETITIKVRKNSAVGDRLPMPMSILPEKEGFIAKYWCENNDYFMDFDKHSLISDDLEVFVDYFKMISTPDEIYLLQDKSLEWKTYPRFVLASDIDMADRTWTPVVNFCGKFSGNGNTIRNLRVNADSKGKKDYYGLFGNIHDGAIVCNITLENCVVDGGDFGICGGITGFNYGILHKCKIKGGIIKGSTVGSIVGQLDGGVYFCSAEKTVLNGYTTGGIAGETRGGCIGHCYTLNTSIKPWDNYDKFDVITVLYETGCCNITNTGGDNKMVCTRETLIKRLEQKAAKYNVRLN